MPKILFILAVIDSILRSRLIWTQRYSLVFVETILSIFQFFHILHLFIFLLTITETVGFTVELTDNYLISMTQRIFFFDFIGGILICLSLRIFISSVDCRYCIFMLEVWWASGRVASKILTGVNYKLANQIRLTIWVLIVFVWVWYNSGMQLLLVSSAHCYWVLETVEFVDISDRFGAEHVLYSFCLFKQNILVSRWFKILYVINYQLLLYREA